MLAVTDNIAPMVLQDLLALSGTESICITFGPVVDQGTFRNSGFLFFSFEPKGSPCDNQADSADSRNNKISQH